MWALSTLLLSAVCLLAPHGANGQEPAVYQMHASGTSNIAPFLWEMFEDLMVRAKPAAILSYRSVGSSAGQAEIQTNTSESISDFSCGDIPLPREQWLAANATGNPVLHVPLLAGTISVFAKVPGISEAAANQSIKLPPCTLVKIFRGDITSWNDSEIVDFNPDLQLPDRDIEVVHRSTGSSSTAALTSYLREASLSSTCTGNGIWLEEDVGPTVNETTWSVNKTGVPNSQEMIQTLLDKDSAIGYVESAQGVKAGLKEVQIQNRNATFLRRFDNETDVAGTSVLNETLPASLLDDFSSATLINRPGQNTWPLSLISYCYVREDITNQTNGGGLTEFVLKFLLSDEAANRMYTTYGLTPMPPEMRESFKTQLQGTLKKGLPWTEEGDDNVAYVDGQGNRVMSPHRRSHVLRSLSTLSDSMSTLTTDTEDLFTDVSGLRDRNEALQIELSALSTKLDSLESRLESSNSTSSSPSPSPSTSPSTTLNETTTVTQDEFSALEASTQSTDNELRRELDQLRSDQDAKAQEALDVAIAGIVLGLILGLAGLIVGGMAYVKAGTSRGGGYGISATDNLAVDNPYFSRA